MSLVSIVEFTLAFGEPPLLERASAKIHEGERIALLGRNGCGKSSLLKCLAGLADPDGGEIHLKRGCRVGYLTQEVPETMEGTAYQAVAGGLAELGHLLNEYDLAARQVADNPGEAAMRRLEAAQQAAETTGAWELHHRVTKALEDLHVPAHAVCEKLSGGMKRRVLLARALVGRPELLLLDEPTNHLDISAIDWLEERLKTWEGTVVMVTHDRMLVRRVATRILEMDRGSLLSWDCSWDAFLERKEEALRVEAEQWDNFDKKLAKEEAWVRAGIKARRTRNEGRVRALLRLREERAKRRTIQGAARIRLNEAERGGEMVIEAEGIGFGWEADKPLVRDLDARIVRGDRIGVLGPNGSGKTTLLRLLLGELEPSAGSVRHGTRLEVVYSDQLRSELDPDTSVLDTIAEGHEFISFRGGQTHVHGYLSDFLFTRERMEAPVSSLSGGERNRLVLAKLFTKPCNVLVLDEPTNDLDVETLEILEQLLADFDGTLLLVSHDREFLNQVVTSTLVLEGEGRVTAYAGGYDDWLRQRPQPEPELEAPEKKQRIKPPQPRRLSYKEKLELEALEPRIEALEQEKVTIESTLADPEFYKGDPEEIARTNRRLPALDEELEQAYARWEELESLRS